jgi:hypothetical protein
MGKEYCRQKKDDKGMEGIKDQSEVMDIGTKEIFFLERLKLYIY